MVKSTMPFVLALAICGFVPHAKALTEAEAVAQIKASIKTQIADLKKNNADNLDLFNSQIDGVIDDYKDGVIPDLATVLSTVASAIQNRVLNFAFSSPGESCVESIAADTQAALAAANVEAPFGFRPGDFGSFDKVATTIEKENAKSRKKMLAKLKKLAAVARSVSSHELTFVIPPFPQTHNVAANIAGSVAQVRSFAITGIVAGSDASSSNDGAIVVCGYVGTGNVDILIERVGAAAGAPQAAAPNGFGIWNTTFSSLLEGHYLVRANDQGNTNSTSVEAIGVP